MTRVMRSEQSKNILASRQSQISHRLTNISAQTTNEEEDVYSPLRSSLSQHSLADNDSRES